MTVHTVPVNHEYFMHRCLELAAQGRGLVGGNPLVGALLVRGEEIVGNGFYQGSGSDHAEVVAVVEAAHCAASTGSALTLYVNLEPCCHHGNTPPCTEFIIQSGIKHVVYGMQDPDSRVSGQGIYQLIDSGVEVTGPILRTECERLNRGYISLRTKGRPYITLKKAQTSEGKVASDDGSKLCITSDAQNEWSHEYLRSTHDAILVGVGTVITDDPQLNCRNAKCKMQNAKYPTPIIFDPDLRIPIDAKVVREGTIIITVAEPKPIGDATVVQIPKNGDYFDWEILWSKLPGISSILVEGGPTTWSAFKEAGLVDEEVILVNSLS